MLYLLSALFFSVCIFFTFKYFDKFGINILPAITFSYLIASVSGYFSGSQANQVNSLFEQPWLVMAVFTGMSFILTFLVFAVSTQKVGVAMTVVSGKMSIILTVAVGFLLLAETMNFMQITGIATALAAFYLINTAKNDGPVEKKYLFLPVLLFFGTGANDSLMKLSGVYYPGRDEIQFLTVTFLTAFAIGSIIMLLRLFNRRLKITWNDMGAGVLLGVLNWFSTYFFIKGLYILPISLFIPVFNAALIFIAAVSGYFFFGEKLSVLNRIGILMALLAIAVIAFS